jgi:hypothetical protein
MEKLLLFFQNPKAIQSNQYGEIVYPKVSLSDVPM